ncbi:MAG: signal peptidase I [Clostridia bacterium]|nr:signal peptidase I [Clostridia bacterium]
MKAKKVISNIFTTVIILLSVVLLTVGLIPVFTSYDGYYVSTDSMEPAMNVGDLVFAKEVSFEDIKVGDVLAFTKEGSEKWFSHRVIDINTEEKSFRTKGDHNNVEDPYFTSFDAVVGRVEKRVPLLGFIPLTLSYTWGKIALVLIYVFYIAYEVENAASKKRKKG